MASAAGAGATSPGGGVVSRGAGASTNAVLAAVANPGVRTPAAIETETTASHRSPVGRAYGRRLLFIGGARITNSSATDPLRGSTAQTYPGPETP